MKFILKRIRRLILFVLILAIAAVVINYRTRFFKDIGSYVPFLTDYSPETVEAISEWSDKINEYVSEIPSPMELWAKLRNIELPIDPDDIAANVYHSSDTMLNFYTAQNISVAIDGSELDVYGVTDNYNERYLAYQFLNSNNDVLEQFTDICDSDGKFRKIMRIPDGTHQFALFVGAEQYGEYTGKVYNYIYLNQADDGGWRVPYSPVYDSNIALYEKDKSRSSALKNTYDICSSETNVSSLAESVTGSYESDYDKAVALHDWVCQNIYYDTDSVSSSGINTAAYVATDVINSKQAVCLGYSNLYAALCRAVGIPCNVVTGYALGVAGDEASWTETSINSTDPNHAWNEVYLDNRWVIVDTTWDSQNTISGGVRETGKNISHLYFDANIRFFSQNHKILKYSN